MSHFRIYGLLIAYYLVIGAIIGIALLVFPQTHEYLPVGGVEALISQPVGGGLDEAIQIRDENVGNLGESLFWLVTAIIGALLTAFPVSWVYMAIRTPEEYDQSMLGTIIMLPIVVTSIVIIVQNSLALAFSLAGIAGAVRFRNSLKSSGDALFILLSVGIGLSAGIGAMELAIVMSVAFNFCFCSLWAFEYGEREMMKRYWSDVDPSDGAPYVPEPPKGGVAPVAAAPAAPPPQAPPSAPGS
jgi:hypothetical protein